MRQLAIALAAVLGALIACMISVQQDEEALSTREAVNATDYAQRTQAATYDARQIEGFSVADIPAVGHMTGNLLPNPSFEGDWNPDLGGSAPEGWHTWACNGCPALDDRLTGLPEWDQTRVDNRVHSGDLAWKQFAFWRPGSAGIYTEVPIPEDAQYCTFSIWFHAWSANEWADTETDPRRYELYTGHGRVGFDTDHSILYDPLPFTSDRATVDDRRNLTLRLGAGPAGADPLTLTYGEVNGYRELGGGKYSFYDHWTQIVYTVHNLQPVMRFAAWIVNLWGLTHNDGYYDDASLNCWVSAEEPAPTPTPSGGTATPVGTPSGNVLHFECPRGYTCIMETQP